MGFTKKVYVVDRISQKHMRQRRLPCNQIDFDLSDEPFHSNICIVRGEWFLVLVLSIVEVGTDQFCQPAVMLKLVYIKGRESLGIAR